MTTHQRETQRLKDKNRKAVLKATSLARTKHIPTRSRPTHLLGSASQADPSHQAPKSSFQEPSALFEPDATPMDIEGSLPENLPPPHQVPIPSGSNQPTANLSAPRPFSPVGIDTGGSDNSDGPGMIPSHAGTPPPLALQLDEESAGEMDIYDGGDQASNMGDGSSDDDQPWFLAVDDDEWQVPSPSDPGSPAGMDDDLDNANPAGPVHSPDASLITSSGETAPIHIPCTSQTHYPSRIYTQSHSMWFIRILLILIVYLHFSFHLPYTACNILLFCISLMLQRLNLTRDLNRMPISLVTAIKALHLHDQFVVYPICPTCHRIETTSIPEAEQAAFTCPGCDSELFSSSPSYRYLSTLLEPLNAITSRSRPQPKLVVSYRSIPELLSEFLSRDGMVESMDAWREKARGQGRLGDVMDGRIWKELQGPDGKQFFGDHCPDELRIGLVVHLDWCNFRRSAQSTHHSTGLFSISVANLPESERYQTKNLLIPCIIPGPKEPNTRQLQEYIVLMVEEFLQLYERGLDSPASPDRLIRAAVTLVICDHPAMCKFFGFADKRHENSPCHRCDVKASEWWTEESLSCGCRLKTFEELRELAFAYRQLPPEEQEQEFKRSGVRWFAFLKLPYFNPLRMAVLDPMHNILLGVVKTQWYDIWIKKERALRETTKDGTKRELEDVHSLLRTAEFPDWLGRIPSQIGVPAGGSLSADEWKALVLVFGPLALPVVWDDWIDAAETEVQNIATKASEKRRKLEKQYERDLTQWEDSHTASQHIIREQAKGRLRDLRPYTKADLQDPPQEPELPPVPDAEPPRLKPGEMELFLKLSAALTVLLARTVYLQDLEVAHMRLLEYLQGYAEMYGSEAVKPNFHWATHLYEQILDYGPVYGFWAFLQERLNFIVKSFRTNNHGQGELEVTMMRSYSALTSLRNILTSAVTLTSKGQSMDQNESFILGAVVARLLADPVARGTLEATAQSVRPGDSTLYTIGPQKPTQPLDPAFVTALLCHINSQPPFLAEPVLRPSNPRAVPSRTLSTFITPINYMVLDGRKITPLDAMRGSGRASIIQARWGDAHQEKVWVGELLKVFISLQDGLSREPLAAIRWLKPTDVCPLRRNIWTEYRDVLDVRIWEYQVFIDESGQAPPTIIPFSKIVSQAARITVRKSKGSLEKLWLTIGLDKHGTRL